MVKAFYAKVFPSLEEDAFFKHLDKVEERRREKILSSKNRRAALQSLAAGSLLHEVLCRETGLAPQSAPPFFLEYGERGKPRLRDYPGLYFNLSHSGGYVCCGAGDVPMGVDIQQMRSLKEGVARRFFTERDNRILAACREEEREKLFFRLWSIKESYVKLTGRGIAEDFDRFEIDLEENRILLLEPEREKENPGAYFAELDCIDRYCLCVCTTAPQQRPVFEEISLI